ncbi:MAG: single-stranded-DNA-specific exonuclease, partial [Patiriisocius sp.]
TPLFITKNLKETGYGKCVGEDKTHLRLTVKQGTQQFVCIGFGMGDKKEIACSSNFFNAAYVIDENEWQGNVNLQLRLKDIKC